MGEKLEYKGKGPLKKGVLKLQNGDIVRVGEEFDSSDVDAGVLKDLMNLKPPAVGPKAKAKASSADGDKKGKKGGK